MKKIFLFFVVIALSGCTKGLVTPHRTSRNDGWPDAFRHDSAATHPSDSAGSDPVGREDLYLLTVEYPPEYDFITDSLKGSVNCFLKVYRSFLPVFSLEVSDRNLVGSEPDRCLLDGPDLYTFFDGVVKRCGEELFRLPSNQILSDIAVHEGCVYTLTFDSRGWMLCRDGTILCSCENGTIVHRLYFDGDSPSLSYISDGRFYTCSGGVSTLVQCDARNITDVCILKGETFVLSNDNGRGYVYSSRNNISWTHLPLQGPNGGGIRNSYIYIYKGVPYFLYERGSARLNEGVGLADEDDLVCATFEQCSLPQVYSGDLFEDLWICGHAKDNSIMAFGKNFRYAFPYGYISPQGSIRYEGKRYFALGRGQDDSHPAVYCEGELYKILEINGLPLALSVR